MASYEVLSVSGIKQLQDFQNLPKEIGIAASRALNATLKRTRADASKRIRQQVNFSASYLNQNDRLAVTQNSRPDNLEGIIAARTRPTSLARFATGNTPNKMGVTVQVKPGSARYMRRAFLIKLNRGSTQTETQFNLGLAMRLKPGEDVRNKKDMIKIASGLYLFYGPSVAQAFGTNDDGRASVRKDVQPAALDFFEDEFLRLLDLGK